VANEETPISKALKSFLDAVTVRDLPSESTPLLLSRGRVLAGDLSATIDDPPYSRSIMEGYVVCVSDLSATSEEQPVRLDITGEIKVGQGRVDGLGPGRALQVTTGSFIPAGDYAVVKRWEVKHVGNQIAVSKPVKQHENIEVQGELREKGAVLFEIGHQVGSDDLFLLASQGILDLTVVRRPRVALFSSGNEVTSATTPLKLGSIWDCNQYGLSSLIEEAGGIPHFQGIIKDDLTLFTQKLKEGLQQADMAVISGGTAVDGKDFTAALLNAAGSPGVLVNGIPMRSGKPIVLGVAEGKPILCVAGHPPEAARGFRLFGKPMIEHLTGEQSQSA